MECGWHHNDRGWMNSEISGCHESCRRRSASAAPPRLLPVASGCASMSVEIAQRDPRCPVCAMRASTPMPHVDAWRSPWSARCSASSMLADTRRGTGAAAPTSGRRHHVWHWMRWQREWQRQQRVHLQSACERSAAPAVCVCCWTWPRVFTVVCLRACVSDDRRGLGKTRDAPAILNAVPRSAAPKSCRGEAAGSAARPPRSAISASANPRAHTQTTQNDVALTKNHMPRYPLCV